MPFLTTLPSEDTFPLWSDRPAPGSLELDCDDIPTLTQFLPGAGDPPANGAAVVICPGGGYGALADHEAGPVAKWLNSLGVTAFVLRYRLAPRYRHPVMLGDAQRALRTVRARATDFGIDPTRIGILGFSAGGHLAASAATHFDAGDPSAAAPIDRASSRPDLAILIYGVLTLRDPHTHAGTRTNLLGPDPDIALVSHLSTEEQVTPDTPPMFLVHSIDDVGVPVENSLHLALALSAARVPFAVQIYDRGGHGYGLATDDPVLSAWPRECAAWMRARGFLG
jgi:acetyl esterase/lipase